MNWMISLNIFANFGSVSLATAMTDSCVVSFIADNGKHLFETTDTPNTRIPQCLATSTSGTVDIPTRSPPMTLIKLYSDGVSRFGPCNAT